jgi:hypothetical protein
MCELEYKDDHLKVNLRISKIKLFDYQNGSAKLQLIYPLSCLLDKCLEGFTLLKFDYLCIEHQLADNGDKLKQLLFFHQKG